MNNRLLRPGGARLGTLGLTSRGFIEEDMEKVAEYLHKAAELTTEIREKAGKKNDDFETYIQDYQPIKELKQEVEVFIIQYLNLSRDLCINSLSLELKKPFIKNIKTQFPSSNHIKDA
jgi:glycine/serine hydroxymethyltransferase